MWCLDSPKQAFAHCWAGLWENHLPKLSMVVTQKDCTCRPELCNALSSSVTPAATKNDTKYLRRQPGPKGHQSSGNSPAPPPIVHAMGNGEWISHWITKVDQEPLISAWSFVQPSAIHMLVEKFWRGLFIWACKFLLGPCSWFHPGPAPWVSQPWDCHRNWAKQLLTYLFPIQLEA